MWTCGRVCGDPPRRLDEVDAVIVVLLDAGGDGEDVRVEDDVLGREADLLGQELVGAGADLDLARLGVGLALLVEGHDDDGGAVGAARAGHARRNASSPSFIEIELTIGLPCTHFSPASMTAHFERVDHHRHAGDVGLGGDEVEELDHRLLGVDQALVHVDVDDLRAVGDLVARDVERGGVVAGGDQLAELAPSR